MSDNEEFHTAQSSSGGTAAQQAPAAPTRSNANHYRHIQLPIFIKSDPALWFLKVEEIFNISLATDEEIKYSLVVAALPLDVISEVRNVLANKPATTPYSHLKAALLKVFSCTFDDRFQALLRDEKLGDRKPSQLLARMQSLMQENNTPIDKTIIKTLFMQRMPDIVRQILAPTVENSSVETLAEMADNIHKANPTAQSSTSVHAINYDYQKYIPKAGNDDQLAILKQISSDMKLLSSKFDKMLNQNHQSRGRSSSRYNNSGNRDKSQENNNTSSTYCFYHARYGANANKCNGTQNKPCNYPNSGNA